MALNTYEMWSNGIKIVFFSKNLQKSPRGLGLRPQTPVYDTFEYRRVARIWKRGRAFLKEWEKCKRPWPEFSLFLKQFHTVCPKIQTKFLGKLRKLKVFSAQNEVVSKKKKRSSPKLRLIFRPKSEFQTFFQPKNRWSPKKKKKKRKKVFTEIETDFSAKFGNSNVWGGAVFLWWGLFSIFHKKSASKATKTCDFAYFTSQWGGSSPPAPWLRYCLSTPGLLNASPMVDICSF